MDRAFENCTALTTVTLPDSVEAIIGTFAGCTALTNIKIPRKVFFIEGAFAGCTSLTDIAVAEENPYYCAMSGIVYSKDQKMIVAYPAGRPDTAFAIPEGTTGIGNGAFYGCTNLTQVTIPEGVTSIGDRAFYTCTGLTEITIPEGVTSIGDCAFAGYSTYDKNHTQHTVNMNLTSVSLPNSLTSIGGGAFQYCTKLESVVIPDGVTDIERFTFSGCESLQSISIPDSVTAIGGSAFSGCKSLKSIAIPDGVTRIDGFAFVACESLESVVIPGTVTEIGNVAFNNGDHIKDVYFLGAKDAWQKVSIESENEAITENATIHYFSEWTREKEPTCTETGSETSTCSEADCGKTFTHEIPALGHSWDEGKVTKPATETEDGVKTFTCTRCSETKTETIPATGVVDVTEMFTDVSHSWADDGIQYCVTHQLMSGVGGNLFAPKMTTTRAQIVQILYNLEGEPKVSGTMPFTDLTQNWYKDAVLWAYQTGVVVGTSATTFEPDRPVTREQIAVILMEYVTKVLKLERTWTPADLSVFPDAGSVSDWAKDALADAVALGLISGASNGGQTLLEPQGSATREQVATILMKFCKNVKK